MRRIPEIVDRHFDTGDRYQFHPDLTLPEAEALAQWCGGYTQCRVEDGRIRSIVIIVDGVPARMGEWIVRDGHDFRIETTA